MARLEDEGIIIRQNSSWRDMSDDEVVEYVRENFNGWSPIELEKDPEGDKVYSAIGRRGLMARLLEEEIIVKSKAPFYYDFRNKRVEFGSSPERTIGMLLHKYGLIKNFEEDENIHVKGGEGQHSIDFLVGNTFIEYHPLGGYDVQRGRDTDAKMEQYKWENITKPEYQDTWFWHLTEVEQLYDVLQDSAVKPLMGRKHRNLSLTQFRKDVKEAEEKARVYDSINFN